MRACVCVCPAVTRRLRLPYGPRQAHLSIASVPSIVDGVLAHVEEPESGGDKRSRRRFQSCTADEILISEQQLQQQQKQQQQHQLQANSSAIFDRHFALYLGFASSRTSLIRYSQHLSTARAFVEMLDTAKEHFTYVVHRIFNRIVPTLRRVLAASVRALKSLSEQQQQPETPANREHLLALSPPS